MMAARSTPGRVPRTKCAIAVRAPVLPALTHAQARPSCTRSIARRIEESFLRRIASRGLSAIATTWEAATTVARARTEAGSGAGAWRLFLLFGLGALLDHAPAPIETIRCDPVAQVCLTGLRIGRQCRLGEPVV